MSKVCKCGRKIFFAETSEGKIIPLDPTPPVYEHYFDESLGKNVCKKLGNAAVSHFATCKNANEFSGSNQPELI